MLRDEPTIRPNLYRLPKDPVAARVLVPAFRQAIDVRGAFGWFTAGWISRLAHGLAVYLIRDEVKPIDLTVAPALYAPEYDALRDATGNPEEAMKRIATVLEDARAPDADMLSRHAVDCLTWMVATSKLRLRVAKPYPDANYHPKVWIFYDGLDHVAVRGSANATGRAYGRGIEHMDVDCTWDNAGRVTQAIEMVDDWSRGRDPQIEQVLELSEALRETIIRLAPDREPTIREYENAMTGSGAGSGTGGTGSDTGEPTIFRIPPQLQWRDGPYRHQGEAVSAWEDTGRRGVIAMATGAGKTITALICTYRAWQEHNGPFLLVVSAPSNPIISQWQTACQAFGLQPVLPSRAATKRDKQRTIGDLIVRLRFGGSGHIETLIATNDLLWMREFQEVLRGARQRIPNLALMHVGDEAHTLGSPSFLRSEPDFFDLRLGLSATPERQYDDEGTRQLLEYFGPSVYEFGLDRAIGFCLVPYDYQVHVVHLASEELDDFLDLTARIGRLVAQRGGHYDFSDEHLTALMVQRRSVIETATAKLEVLRALLRDRAHSVSHTLVYTSSKNPEQFESARKVLADLGVVAAPVTQHESAKPQQLRRTLDAFEDGDFSVLVAKKVLDEGVDIPQIREAILLASSTVEREWVQRRGRVLRRWPGKHQARIHDVLALPPPRAGLAYDDSVVAVISSELDRVRAFGRHALNRREVLQFIGNLHRDYFG